MANIKSARKRARQAVKRRSHNVSMRTAARSAIKDVKKAIASGDKKAAAAALVRSQAVIDRTAAKGIVHRNAAARQKSRLAHAIKAMAQEGKQGPSPV
ncbi:MAG: 30S ribosomal protein S20 [Betaproteobacteria bacterium RBG_16_66_20]|nr:MAG: 30S ribosomal protein S20 [Betaproteobacteria bacterium RBG_16_66_20]